MMRSSISTAVIFIIFMALLTACDTAADIATEVNSDPDTAVAGLSSDTPEPTAIITDQAAPTNTPAPDAAASNGEYAAPEWASLPLTNAVTGETFSLADFAGKTVFVEPMATWCSNCRQQQRQVVLAMDSLGTNDYVFISLSVETGLQDAVLAEYAERNEFPQMFAVGSNDLINALIEQYGRTIINPPLTPHFTIAPDGSTSSLFTGYHSSTQLVDELNRIRTEG